VLARRRGLRGRGGGEARRALGPAAHIVAFHPTGTCGAFGAAAAAGAVLGSTVNALATALGIAGSQASGSMEFLATGPGRSACTRLAACAGLHAAALAAAGFRAPATILEGRSAFSPHTRRGADPTPLFAPVSSPRRVRAQRDSVKPHACCRYMQGPIDATLALAPRMASVPRAVERSRWASSRAPSRSSASRWPPSSDLSPWSTARSACPSHRGRPRPGRRLTDEFTLSTIADPPCGGSCSGSPPSASELDALYRVPGRRGSGSPSATGGSIEAPRRAPRGDPENFPGSGGDGREVPEARGASCRRVRSSGSPPRSTPSPTRSAPRRCSAAVPSGR